jgi:hypothetical protein
MQGGELAAMGHLTAGCRTAQVTRLRQQTLGHLAPSVEHVG